MQKNRSSLSKARSYAEIGEYWDQHDLSDVWGKTRKVKFEVVAEPEATYYPVERNLSEKIQSVAKKQGVHRIRLLIFGWNRKRKSKGLQVTAESYTQNARSFSVG